MLTGVPFVSLTICPATRSAIVPDDPFCKVTDERFSAIIRLFNIATIEVKFRC